VGGGEIEVQGIGRAYSAVSIINALATGMGGALGIDRYVEVSVKKSSETKVTTLLHGNPIKVNLSLVEEILSIFKREYSLNEKLHITIDSEIPPERGLKSSSAVANALIIALFDYLGIGYNEMEILSINVDASLRSGVSITGALDDAAASLLGGLVFTDNINRRIISHRHIDRLPVAILYPPNRLRTSELHGTDFSKIRPIIARLFKMALEGRWMEAATLNGIFYASFLGHDTKPIFTALEAGALAAGLSGKGPAYFAISRDATQIIERWRLLNEYDIFLAYTR